MKPTIFLALTHDWELRGDGSGDIEQIQFLPLRELLDVYRKHDARTTFLPDVMQQLAFRRLEQKYPELKSGADSWDEHLREAFRQGHDVQLHLHPQWNDARYELGHWHLNGHWSITNYDRETAHTMLRECKQYLENLLRPLDGNYQCVAFRAGALAAAPSDHLFNTLAAIGIKVDVSIAGGLLVNQANLQLDYRHCESDFLPFYPRMNDARRVSAEDEEIVCVPIHHFYGSRGAVLRQNISLIRKKFTRQNANRNIASKTEEASQPRANRSQVYEKIMQPLIRRKYFVSDTGRLSYALMREMLRSIRTRAAASNLLQLPIVLTNHPKDIRDLGAIDRLVGELSQAEDIRFITLPEMAKKLQSGEFNILKRGT